MQKLTKRNSKNTPMTYIARFILVNRTSSATSNAIHILIAL